MKTQDEMKAALAAKDAEIERIKQNHGCARHQGTTQFCAEAVALQNEIAELLGLLGLFQCGCGENGCHACAIMGENHNKITAALAEKGGE